MNEILPRLYLGDVMDAKLAPADFAVLAVLWKHEPGLLLRAKHIQTTDYQLPSGYACAIAEKMDEAARWIRYRPEKQEKVLVHCQQGIERAPLTVVWYLMRCRGMSLSVAYRLVTAQRPVVEYRGGWLQGCLIEQGNLKTVPT